MANIFKRIFGASDVVSKAADGVYNGIDAAILTKEERISFHLDFLKAYEPFKLAQRLLALIVGIPYVAIWLVCAALYVASMVADPCAADAVCKSAQMLTASKELAAMNNDTLGTPFALILAFYFAGGAVEGVVRARARK
jgi:uncharacterized membrane protein YciS (DUF1049 family)